MVSGTAHQEQRGLTWQSFESALPIERFNLCKVKVDLQLPLPKLTAIGNASKTVLQLYLDLTVRIAVESGRASGARLPIQVIG